MKKLKIGNLIALNPVVQGGMGVGVSLSGLAASVANHNGIGVISSAGLGVLYRHLSPDFQEASILGLREELRKARKKTRGIIGVNIMVAMSNFPDMMRTAIEGKADIIFSGAGLPLDMPSYLTPGSHTKLVPIVSSGRAAKVICDKWKKTYNYFPDAIVVEGPKAGGHLGFSVEQIFDENYALEKLVADVRTETLKYKAQYNVKIPIIAAGGIYTGQDIYNIMQCGADGVQMGSRFVTTNECDASPAFKQAYLNASEDDIQIIKSPVGMPGRVISNAFTLQVEQGEREPLKCPYKCIKTCTIEKSPYCIILALYNAYKGNLNNGYAFAGSNAYRAEKIESVRGVFSSLNKEYLKSWYFSKLNSIKKNIPSLPLYHLKSALLSVEMGLHVVFRLVLKYSFSLRRL